VRTWHRGAPAPLCFWVGGGGGNSCGPPCPRQAGCGLSATLAWPQLVLQASTKAVVLLLTCVASANLPYRCRGDKLQRQRGVHCKEDPSIGQVVDDIMTGLEVSCLEERLSHACIQVGLPWLVGRLTQLLTDFFSGSHGSSAQLGGASILVMHFSQAPPGSCESRGACCWNRGAPPRALQPCPAPSPSCVLCSAFSSPLPGLNMSSISLCYPPSLHASSFHLSSSSATDLGATNRICHKTQAIHPQQTQPTS
jgi:hypothetical protein